MISVIIGGDFAPTETNYELFDSGNIEQIFGVALLDLLKQADFRIFNLEVPLTDLEAPIDKCGPNLIAPVSTIKGIGALNPSILILANNHILDQGEQGLLSTLELLKGREIGFVGAGLNLTEAAKPAIVEKSGIRIGFYACAEHEFSIATENRPGANPFDPLDSLDHIESLAKNCDHVIVFYHGGKEHYRYPSPGLQKICRKIVDKGAGVVICQHSHCIGAYEQYENGTIVYGQGNFIFDNSESEFWKTSLLIKVILTKAGASVDYIPLIKYGNVVRLAGKKQSQEILKDFYERSMQIKESGFIEHNYYLFAEKNIYGYLRSLFGFGKWFSRVDRYLFGGRLLKVVYNKRKILAMQNYIECEAHRELLLRGLDVLKK